MPDCYCCCRCRCNSLKKTPNGHNTGAVVWVNRLGRARGGGSATMTTKMTRTHFQNNTPRTGGGVSAGRGCSIRTTTTETTQWYQQQESCRPRLKTPQIWQQFGTTTTTKLKVPPNLQCKYTTAKRFTREYSSWALKLKQTYWLWVIHVQYFVQIMWTVFYLCGVLHGTRCSTTVHGDPQLIQEIRSRFPLVSWRALMPYNQWLQDCATVPGKEFHVWDFSALWRQFSSCSDTNERGLLAKFQRKEQLKNAGHLIHWERVMTSSSLTPLIGSELVRDRVWVFCAHAKSIFTKAKHNVFFETQSHFLLSSFSWGGATMLALSVFTRQKMSRAILSDFRPTPPPAFFRLPGRVATQ